MAFSPSLDRFEDGAGRELIRLGHRLVDGYLELVVAAVAGLAAVAVVLVQAVVGDTAESVASHSARQEAAELATVSLQDKWQAQVPTSEDHAEEINDAFRRRCLQLGIIYGDVPLGPEAKGGTFDLNTGGWQSGRLPKCTLSMPR